MVHAHGLLRGRPRDADREQAICDSAVALLAEVGYERMTVDAVAAHAHASKATIYRRWPGKPQLVVDAMRRRGGSGAPVDTGTLRGDLLELMRQAAIAGSEDVDLLSGLISAMRADEELAEQVRTSVIEGKRCSTRDIVQRAIDRGELRPDVDPDLVHEVAPALVFFRVLVCGEPADEAFCAHVVDDVVLPLLHRPCSS